MCLTTSLSTSVGGVESERGRVAEVELDDLVSGSLELASSPQDRPAYVVPDVAEPACLRNLHFDDPSAPLPAGLLSVACKKTSLVAGRQVGARGARCAGQITVIVV